ncbi:MAG: LD-carboxypeptidase [Paludibacteraceae bacterium]|nr:LD-carboxypeptidase [Paludibacteraceae bacterium]
MLTPLQPNDLVRIVSPSGVIEAAYIDGAKNTLSSWGLQVIEGEYCRQSYGRFAGTQAQRISDLQQALDDQETKAILCSRGGYGLTQIVDKLDFTTFCSRPKWLIGFSDVTVLHNAITNLGFSSVHAIMAKHLTELNADSEAVAGLKNLLFGNLPEYIIHAHPQNRSGKATGKLIGGNLSVIYGLRGTPFDLPYEGNILFIEDIAEKPYHIDRMMQNLRLGGIFSKISGLVVGQFSHCNEDPMMLKSIEEIISGALAGTDIPVVFNFPAGHVDDNHPLLLGAQSTLTITSQHSILKSVF